jgi:hypothetical protein
MRTDTPHLDLAQFMRNDIIRRGLPIVFYFSIAELSTLISIFFRLAFILLRRAINKMQNQNNAPFPFMQLPPELRDMVYENLLEDPHYPPPRPCPKAPGSSWLSSLSQFGSTDSEAAGHKSNFLFLANKQIYAEYMDLMCKKTTFHMTIAPHNYTPPATPAEEEKDIWQISPQVLKKIKRCDIKLVTTSIMLGVSDPRNMKPEEWALARQMRRQLSEVENISELNLHVKAIADHLWNPLWVWYHATQALRETGSSSDHEKDWTKVDVVDEEIKAVAATGPASSGPQFDRITFSLDMWSPGENYLMRDPCNSNQWAWWCLKGHCVGQVGAELTVRQFCSWLYDCPTCYSEEDEGE